MSALSGRRILITRAAGDLARLAELLRARGAEAIPFPCIAFAEPEGARGTRSHPSALDASLQRLASDPPAAIGLASPHAVESLVAQLRARGLEPARALADLVVGAAGEGTADALAAHGVAALHPAEGVGAEALARVLLDALGDNRLHINDDKLHINDNGLRPKQNELHTNQLAPRRVLLAQAAEASPVLAERLRAAGFEVEVAVLYRTVPLEMLAGAHEPGLARLRAREIDAIAFASGSAARGFSALLRERALPLAACAKIACMGEACAAVARSLGFTVAAVGAGGFDSMLDALAACYSPHRLPPPEEIA